MKRSFRFWLAGILAWGLAVMPVFAQTYPVTTPTYVPTATFLMGTVSASANQSLAFQINNQSTLRLYVTGTYSVLSAQVQASVEPGPSATFGNVLPARGGVYGAKSMFITGNGTYDVDVSGYKQVRINVITLTGTSVTFNASAGEGVKGIVTLPDARPTYSASSTISNTTAGASDLYVLTGNATTLTRLLRASCSGSSTAIGAGVLTGGVRSTADSGGTAVAVTAVPHDSNSPAASSNVKSYAASTAPTPGTLVGLVRSDLLVTTPLSTTTVGTAQVSWVFGQGPGEQEIVLRAATQTFAIASIAALPAGDALSCSLTWTEE